MTDQPLVRVLDWRNVEITGGAIVLYCKSNGGRSSFVEAIVQNPTPNDRGRITLRPIRRQGFSGATYTRVDSYVYVNPTSVTVVNELPPTDVPSEDELSTRGRAIARYRAVAIRNRDPHAVTPPGDDR